MEIPPTTRDGLHRTAHIRLNLLKDQRCSQPRNSNPLRPGSRVPLFRQLMVDSQRSQCRLLKVVNPASSVNLSNLFSSLSLFNMYNLILLNRFTLLRLRNLVSPSSLHNPPSTVNLRQLFNLFNQIRPSLSKRPNRLILNLFHRLSLLHLSSFLPRFNLHHHFSLLSRFNTINSARGHNQRPIPLRLAILKVLENSMLRTPAFRANTLNLGHLLTRLLQQVPQCSQSRARLMLNHPCNKLRLVNSMGGIPETPFLKPRRREQL